MRLAGASAADEDDVSLLLEKAAAGKIAHQRLIDRRALEFKVVEVSNAAGTIPLQPLPVLL